jgi:hypothetical protein
LTSARAFRWTFFIALLWAWPLPLLGLEGTTIPVARFIQLAVALSVLIAIEGAGGMVGALFFLLWGHVLVYALLLFGAAAIIVKQVILRLPDRIGFWIAAAALVALFSWGSFADPYDTAFHHSAAHASLLDLYR